MTTNPTPGLRADEREAFCDECGCTHAPGENTVCPTWKGPGSPQPATSEELEAPCGNTPYDEGQFTLAHPAAQVEKDAKRYRYMRSRISGALPMVRVQVMRRGQYVLVERDLDAAIDAAMQAGKQP